VTIQAALRLGSEAKLKALLTNSTADLDTIVKALGSQSVVDAGKTLLKVLEKHQYRPGSEDNGFWPKNSLGWLSQHPDMVVGDNKALRGAVMPYAQIYDRLLKEAEWGVSIVGGEYKSLPIGMAAGGAWTFWRGLRNVRTAFGAAASAGAGLKALRSLKISKPQVALEMVEGRGAWKLAGRKAGLQWRDSLVYIVKDKSTGELLKVGETGKWESRFGEYLTRAKNEGREIVIDVWKIQDSSRRVRINQFETPLRRRLKSAGNELPWDKSIPGNTP
jgi:hypothetical protein